MSRATYPGAPSYGDMRTWVEGSQVRGNSMLAETTIQIISLLKQHDYQIIIPNAYALLIHKLTVGRDIIDPPSSIHQFFLPITFSSIHQVFLHQFAHPSNFPPSNEDNNKISSIKNTSITIKEVKDFLFFKDFSTITTTKP